MVHTFKDTINEVIDDNDNPDDMDKLVVTLAFVSAALALLVIILCIKLFCCRRDSRFWVHNDGAPLATHLGEDLHISSLAAAAEGNLDMEEVFQEEVCKPQLEEGQFSSPTKTNSGVSSLLYAQVGQRGRLGGDLSAHQSEAYPHGGHPGRHLVPLGTTSMQEVNEVEGDLLATATAVVSNQGQANPGFTSSGDAEEEEEILMDSELQELMLPDMKESKLVEVRSKLLVFISRKIDSTGGQLVLDKMGISLFIPPCAIDRGNPKIIFLALNWDLEDFPQMSSSQTIVSPVVHVGPHGLKLKRPATLSFRHCAFDVEHVKVYSSQTHLMQRKSWSLSDARLQNGKSKNHTILDTECQVHISHFTLYTCIAEGNAPKKWLQLVAFGGRMRARSHYEIRVYLLNNTPCALQFAIENEKKHGFKTIKCPQEFLFVGDGGDMCLQVEGVNEGWSANLMDLKETVPYLNIWHGKCPFCSFIFKHEKQETKDISTTISAYQTSKPEYKLKLKLLSKMSKRKRRSAGTHRREMIPSDLESDGSSLSGGSTGSSQSSGVGPSPLRSISFDPGKPEMRSFSDDSHSSDGTSCSQSTTESCQSHREKSSKLIPHKLKMTLVHLLEPSDTLGNDWRMIASDLGMDTKIPMLKEKGNAFEEVLKIMEEQNKDLLWLAETLTSHQRLDAAGIINSYLQTGKIHS